MKISKKLTASILAIVLALSLGACTSSTPTTSDTTPPTTPTEPTTPPTQATTLKAGTYEGEASGMGGPFRVSVTVDEKGITAVTVLENAETPGVGTVPIEKLPAEIVATQNIAVDSVIGATITSRAILSAVEKALTEAGADVAAFKETVPKDIAPIEKTADIIIVGGGGAGLAAAIAATDAGASVIVIEKTGVLGGNTIVSGGIYNCPDPEMQEPAGVEDSVELYTKQTWEGGDKVANIDLVTTMCANSFAGLEWLEGMGMEFQPEIVQGAGSLYRRTHTAVDPLGTGFINTYKKVLAERADKCEIILNTDGQSLIMDGAKVVGVEGVTAAGAPVTLRANKSVILATGGFASNVELRQKYNTSGKWPDLGASVPNTNMAGVTGDGIFMAETAGANLIDMDQIQLLQLGMPKVGAITGLTNPNNAEQYLFVNKEGKRFVREDGRRDEICTAMLKQTDGQAYLLSNVIAIPDPQTTLTKEGITIAQSIENGVLFAGDTLEDLAAKIGCSATDLQATIDAYNAGVDANKDEFGRTLLTTKLEKGPWYALPRVPSVHHTMGGVQINTDCQALKADGSVVEGLYCAGEITGGIHGGNRLGGNAIVDTVVFGRIAGTNAAK